MVSLGAIEDLGLEKLWEFYGRDLEHVPVKQVLKMPQREQRLFASLRLHSFELRVQPFLKDPPYPEFMKLGKHQSLEEGRRNLASTLKSLSENAATVREANLIQNIRFELQEQTIKELEYNLAQQREDMWVLSDRLDRLERLRENDEEPNLNVGGGKKRIRKEEDKRQAEEEKQNGQANEESNILSQIFSHSRQLSAEHMNRLIEYLGGVERI